MNEKDTILPGSERSRDASCSAANWTLLFETQDGMCHPLRIHFPEGGSEADAMRYAGSYLAKHAWLKTVSQCYPTEPPNAEMRDAMGGKRL